MSMVQARRWLAVATSFTTLTLMSCAGADGPEAGSDHDGVPFGATKSEYQAAFETIAPITIVTQTAGPPGSFASRKEEDYVAAVEEWSGGKISFEISYAQAIAPAGQEDDALADGRLDLAMVTAQLEPDVFPVNSLLLGAPMLVSAGMPVAGTLQGMAFPQELGFGTPEFMDEFAGAGLHVLLPFNIGGSMLFCSEERRTIRELAGAVVAANSTTVAESLQALGMTPTSLAYTEVFEGLERGVVDCSVSSVAQAQTSGLVEPAPYALYVKDSTLGAGAQTYAMSTRVWDELPLVARQLFFDRMDVLYESFLTSYWDAAADTIATATAAGGGAIELDDEAARIVADQTERIMDRWSRSDLVADPDGLVEHAETSAAEWLERIGGELGFDASLGYEELPAWWAENEDHLDLTGYVDALFTETLLPYRPS